MDKALPKGYEYVSPVEVKGPKGGVYYLVAKDQDGNAMYFNNGTLYSFENTKKQNIGRPDNKPMSYPSMDEVTGKLQSGNQFNASRHSAYPYNELYVYSPDGKTKFRLDSYDPDKKEIVSRKETQFSEIQPSTGIGYLNEIPKKYSIGSVIADVPTSKELGGEKLEGIYILEIPVQGKPIPQEIINKANELKIIIRDINGKEYN